MYVCIMHLGINKCLHLEIFNVICLTIRLECRTHLENYKIFVLGTFSPNIQQRKEHTSIEIRGKKFFIFLFRNLNQNLKCNLLL